MRTATNVFARMVKALSLNSRLATSRRLSAGLIAAASLGVAGCDQVSDVFGRTFPTYRYRLTVEINTPEGVKRGSSVFQVETSQAGKYNLDAPYVAHREVRGDAVVVDLGRRGRIFVIFKDDGRAWASEIMLHFIKPVGGDASDQEFRGVEVERVMALRGPIALHANINDDRYPLHDGLPDFVTFSNPADLATAKIVQPGELSSVFGKGVTLRGMTVQITNDPVTRFAAVQSLPWLRDHAAYLRNARSHPTGPIGDLNEPDFTRGM